MLKLKSVNSIWWWKVFTISRWWIPTIGSSLQKYFQFWSKLLQRTFDERMLLLSQKLGWLLSLRTLFVHYFVFSLKQVSFLTKSDWLTIGLNIVHEKYLETWSKSVLLWICFEDTVLTLLQDEIFLWRIHFWYDNFRKSLELSVVVVYYSSTSSFVVLNLYTNENNVFSTHFYFIFSI